MNIKKVMLGVAVVLLAFGITVLEKRVRSGHVHQAPAENAVAPNFSLSDMDGRPLTLSSYRGKVVLLDFWATWCEPCREETPRFVDLQNKYGNQGLQIIGVSMDDSAEPVRDFYKSFKMNYPVVMGNAGIGTQYGGILGLPIAFLIGRDGRIRARYRGAIDTTTLEREIGDLL